MYIIIITVLLWFSGKITPYTYHWGSSCNTYKGTHEFNMSLFLGTWYAILKSSTAAHCIRYQYKNVGPKRVLRPGVDSLYEVEVTSQHTYLGLDRFKHDYVVKRHVGTMKVTSYLGRYHTYKYYDYKYERYRTARYPLYFQRTYLPINFPLGIFGPQTQHVLVTDYKNFAIVHSCQNMAFAHRDCLIILSRRKTLKQSDRGWIMGHIQRAYPHLSISDLSEISHNDCGVDKKNKKGVKIYDFRPNTLCFGNLGDAFNLVGVTIAYGVGYLLDYTRRVLNIMRDRTASVTDYYDE